MKVKVGKYGLALQKKLPVKTHIQKQSHLQQ